jgi:uncharacterized membrane-anchored protein
MMREHALRRQVVGEMHLRRWPPLRAPMNMVQLLRLVDEPDREAERLALMCLPGGGEAQVSAGGGHVAGSLPGGCHFSWERHSEASSLTLFLGNPDGQLFLDPDADAAVAQVLAWAEALPGAVIRATRIHIAETEAEIEATILPQIGFHPSELVSCRIGAGARLWSDFRIGAQGYGSVFLAANGQTQGDLSRLVQRLQELGNYRNLALLGLPLAQSNWPRLNLAVRRLQGLGEDVLRDDERDDDLLQRISGLSTELMAIATTSNFRMSATAAYARLVDERLHDLAVAPIAGFPSLVDFTQRRFLPAVRTCAYFTEREAQLSLRCAQFTSLLRARIETRIESQNARLLASMEQSAARQLRLQQLVEGLSVVAVSYYVIGLAAYLLKGAEVIWPGLPAPVLIGALTLPVVLLIWAAMKRIKARLLE